MSDQQTGAAGSSRGFERGTERLAKLRQRPGATERVAQIREGMREMDRIHAMNIAAIRTAAGKTQMEVAEQLGVGQSVVSRTERSDDMLLSTLGNYLEATGAESASIIVRVHGVDVEFDLFEAKNVRGSDRERQQQ